MLLASIFWAGFSAPFWESARQIADNPWGLVTLIDLYLGFALMALFMAFVEETLQKRLFWIIPLFFLGNIWSALWLFLRIDKIKKKLRTKNR